MDYIAWMMILFGGAGSIMMIIQATKGATK